MKPSRLYPDFRFVRLNYLLIIGLTLALLIGSTPPLLAVGGVNSAPIVGLTTPLYDGTTTSGTLKSQGFNYQTFPLVGAQATETAAGGITTLSTITNTGEYAGYYIKPASAPTLDHNAGYSVHFTVRVVSESHNGPTADKNGDGLADRAGFNVIALSSDLQGVELAFWQDQVWAQQYNPNTNEFTHSPTVETTGFNTTTGLIPYELIILGNTFSLFSNGNLILSGNLHTYSAAGYPYNQPNFIFLGDDTSQADTTAQISAVWTVTNANLPTQQTYQNTDLTINKLGLIDADAGINSVTATFQVFSGTLKVNPLNGVTVNGNNTTSLSLVGPVYLLNTVLANGLIYKSNLTFVGNDTLTVNVNDGGNSGTGGPKSDQKTVIIQIMDKLLVTNPNDDGSGLNVGTLSYALTQAQSGQTITFQLQNNSKTVTLNAGSLPVINSGVRISGSCVNNQPGITIQGNNLNGPGLKLSGNNSVFGLKVTGFKGTQISVPTGARPSKNSLKCVVAKR